MSLLAWYIFFGYLSVIIDNIFWEAFDTNPAKAALVIFWPIILFIYIFTLTYDVFAYTNLVGWFFAPAKWIGILAHKLKK